MPGRDLTASKEIFESPNFALFKAHKTFPRRKIHTGGRTLSHSLGLEQTQIHGVDQDSYKSSQKIRSWIPEPSPPHAAPDHDLPLTPPINMMDHEDEKWIEDRIVAGRSAIGHYRDGENGKVTPIIQRSLPTPEKTPPRVHGGIHALAPPSASREPSLRTESFKTARENLSSDEESLEVTSPSLRPARQKWLRDTKLREIGLGLGLESEDEDPTPTETTSKHAHKMYNLEAFNASSPVEGNDSDGVAVKDGDHGLGHINVRRKRLPNRQRISSHPLPRSPKLGEDYPSLLARSLSLRQRVERGQQIISASTERFAQQIEWPLKEEDIDIDAKLREVDNKRFSQISTTSTVVEAMVIAKPPQRRQTLRHTGKISGLNSEISQANHSNRSSMISTSSTRRRLPRSAITPDREQRRSTATDASGSMTSSLAKVRQDSVPVIVIPQRRSSLKSSAPVTSNASRTMSLTSHRQQLPRPTTAPEEAVGYFDLPQRERRIVSAIIPSAAPAKYLDQSNKGTPPATVSPSPSPLELATNQISEILSVPSASIVSTQSQQWQPQPVLHLSEPLEIQGMNLDRAVAGEWSALRPRSALVTPFSLRSVHSSTPGTLEVNEATAISIYPHTNKSILVIQQMSRGDSNEPAGHSAIIAGNANIALPVPIAPAIIHQSRRPLDSPLKHPRDPPQPPDFKIIPPTPANAPPTDETASGKAPSTADKTRPSGPISMMKRALSARRYSESFITPITRSLSRRHTPTTRRPSVGDDPDGKLHPFWRPRGFWDDLSDTSSDSDSDFGNSGFLVGESSGLENPVLHKNPNSQSPNGRALSRSISLTKRITGPFSQKNNNRHQQDHGRTHTRSRSDDYQQHMPPHQRRAFTSLDNNRSYEFLPPERKRAGAMMPRLGYRVHFVGLKGLAERMEKAKVKREESRRERVREKLRGSIGVVKVGSGGLMSGGMDDLRR